MTADKFKRKLAAILSADVKGYSRLMGVDEEATLRTLQEYKEVMASCIQHYRGRVVGTAGDSILAEFDSVVDAVQCAVEIQQVLKAKNALLTETRRMEFRIGINLGDVIEEGDTIYGDGVNIAARLESLAEAGGICISESAYQQIENKLPLRYEYLGEHQVKNIAKPVRVYKAQIEPETAPSRTRGEKKPGKKLFLRAILGIGIIALGLAGFSLWHFVLRPVFLQRDVASKGRMAYQLPDKPSIVVLPFTNMSGDPKQEFFSDGITEDIITALSKVPMLFVIARNSAFTYKGKPVNVRQISEELGVQYVLEGSVQKSADRVRITAQLIDALTGRHIWAERYDRQLKDIFALQDEVTSNILRAMQVKITEGEQALHRDKGIRNLNCYLKLLEGRNYSDRFNTEGNQLARQMGEEALAMCPESSSAYYLLAATYMMDYWNGLGKSPRESVEKGIELAKKALALDDAYAQPHGLLSFLYSIEREYDKALVEGERAVALDPNGADVNAWYASSLIFAGKPGKAILLLQKAIRNNPLGPAWYFFNLGNALLHTGRFEEAVLEYKKALQRAPNNIFARIGLAATYSMMGRGKEARAEATEILRINPKFTIDDYVKTLPYKDQSQIGILVDASRKAGLK